MRFLRRYVSLLRKFYISFLSFSPPLSTLPSPLLLLLTHGPLQSMDNAKIFSHYFLTIFRGRPISREDFLKRCPFPTFWGWFIFDFVQLLIFDVFVPNSEITRKYNMYVVQNNLESPFWVGFDSFEDAKREWCLEWPVDQVMKRVYDILWGLASKC